MMDRASPRARALKPRWMIGALAALALCAFAAPAEAQYRPAYDDITEQGGDLAECAGIVSAYAGLNPLTHPEGAGGEWHDLLTTILARLYTEPGLQGMTGRYAASAARAYWAGRPRARREAAARACQDRFGG